MTAERPPAPRLAGSASILAAGHVASRVLGLAREQVIAAGWGGSLEASAFSAAARVPTLLYELLIGGALSAALVPVMTAYAARDREEFWRAAGALVTVGVMVCGAAAVAVYAMAEPLASFLARGYGVEGVTLVARMLRLIAPAVLAFGVAGVLIGLLYALERFTLAATTGAVYNLGFILAALMLQGRLGVIALPVGVTLGAMAQIVVLVPGLVRLKPRLRPRLRHPALRRVLVLYVPVALGLLASLVQGGVEPGLASAWGDAGLSWMRYATTLVQFPHGLIAAAISVAILPRLAANHARDEHAVFSATLARGLRTVAVLTIPAAVGLAVLAEPVSGLVFQRAAFGDVDRLAVTAALHLYLLGLPFAAIDWPMNYAFYARQNTLVPAAVGAFSVAVWFAVALRLPAWVAARAGFDSGYLGLVLADSVKQLTHAAVMLVLVHRATAGRGLQGLGRTMVSAGIAAAAMGVVVAGVDHALAVRWTHGSLAWGIRAAAGTTTGLGVYVALAGALGVREVPWLLSELRTRLALVGGGRRSI